MSDQKEKNLKPLIYGLYGMALVLIFMGGVLVVQGKPFIALPIFLISVFSALAGVFVAVSGQKSKIDKDAD